jgi:hypothetical protein
VENSIFGGLKPTKMLSLSQQVFWRGKT